MALLKIGVKLINTDQIRYANVFQEGVGYKVLIDFGNPDNAGDWDLELSGNEAESFVYWLEEKSDVFVIY